MMRRNLKKLINSKNLPDSRTYERKEAGMMYEDTVYLKITYSNGNTEAIKWDDVEEVHAFKRDLGSIDLICLSFKKAYKEKYYEINEEMVGYHELLEILPRRLSGYNPDWFHTVAFPAFKVNLQAVWRRPSKEKNTPPNKK